MKLSDAQVRRLQALVTQRLGLRLNPSQIPPLAGAAAQALQERWRRSPDAVLDTLAVLPLESREWQRLVAEITVGETYFLRDPALFAALEKHVLPERIAARRRSGRQQLHIWSAACATGEEAYSLALVVARLLPAGSQWQVVILGTDINLNALARARRGVYGPRSLRGLPADLCRHLFRPLDGQRFEVQAALRQMVTFAPLNLAGNDVRHWSAHTAAYDLILCRNVLMYFAPEAVKAAAARLQQSLAPGGWLAVSGVEASADLFRPLLPVNFPGAILFHHDPATPSLATTPATGAALFTGAAAAAHPAAAPPSQRSTVREPTAPRPAPRPPNAPPQEPADPAALLEQARALADRGYLAEALARCQSALARDPIQAEAYLLLAAIRQEQGDTTGAGEAIVRALYLEPDSVAAHFALGNIRLRQGKWQRARRAMEIVTELLADQPDGAVVPGTGGLSARQLIGIAHSYLAQLPGTDSGV